MTLAGRLAGMVLGFDAAMAVALAAEVVLAADETPVNVLDNRIVGIQQCCQHIIHRCRVMKLGPGGGRYLAFN
jgi:hypothetical protein